MKNANSSRRIRILFLVPSDFEALKKKGVDHMILERDENGFFDRVVTVHPRAQTCQSLRLNPVHFLYEFKNQVGKGILSWPILRTFYKVAQFLSLIKRLKKIALEHKVDLIRATDPSFTGFLAWVLSRFFIHIPFCVSIHADYLKRHILDPSLGAPTVLGSFFLAKKMTSFVLSHADMVLPIRQSLAEQAISMGANPDHVSVIPHGIDMTPFRSQHDRLALCRELEIDPEKKIISFAGRLSKENYLPDIVKAIKMLSEKRQDFLLVIFGDGDWRESLMSYLKKYPSLQKVIRFYGFQPQKKSYRLRHISDVSLCLMGGFSLIEACASGSPVVAYDVEWHHELIVHRENGILISEGNIQQLALEVEWLLDHSDEAQSFGKKAQEQVMKKHDIFHTSKIKIENYKKILPASS